MPTVNLAALRAALGDDAVLVDPDLLAGYRTDGGRAPETGLPLAVVRPSTTADVQAVVRFASAEKIPVVTRGAATGLSGGAAAVDGCLVLSTERMRSIAVDTGTRTCTAGTGALTGEVKKAAAAHGLWYPPDPSSFEISSIGGNVATNAGGLCCVKYGVTSDYVLGMTIVLADGDAVTLGGPRLKDKAGLSLTKLFVGSEGTLAVITEVVLRLVPPQHAPVTAVALFDTLEAATAAALEVGRRTRPAMLEFMDRFTINAVEDLTRMGLDRTAAALLVIQSDAADAAAAELDLITDACRALASEIYATDDPDDGEAFVQARRLALPAIERRGSVLLEDVGVPLPRLGELVLGIDQIARDHAVEIPLMAHAGDGNAHPVIVYDADDDTQTAQARAAFGAVMDLALDLGGTITGEHGVGRQKRDWLERSVGADALSLNRRIKDALDPEGILNPGCMF